MLQMLVVPFQHSFYPVLIPSSSLAVVVVLLYRPCIGLFAHTFKSPSLSLTIWVIFSD